MKEGRKECVEREESRGEREGREKVVKGNGAEGEEGGEKGRREKEEGQFIANCKGREGGMEGMVVRRKSEKERVRRRV